MARLYANENFPLPVVRVLRNLGHDVLTVSETGKAEQAWPDEDVLEYATQADRALLTFNRKHFRRTLDENRASLACEDIGKLALSYHASCADFNSDPYQTVTWRANSCRHHSMHV